MTNTITEIKLDNLKNHPKNTRKVYSNIGELAESIKKNGILQNLTVVPDPSENGKYLVVIGNRRLRAAQKAGLKTAPCVITEMDEAEQVMTTLVENMQRNDLTLSEEAAGIQMCIEDYGIDIGTIVEKTGLSKTTIRHRINVSKLDQDILNEKMNKGEFQLTLTDIQKLERIKNVYRRSEILSEATDPKNLACRIEQEVTAEKREENLKKFYSLAKKEGISEAPADINPYGFGWMTVKILTASEKLPETILSNEDREIENDGFYYAVIGSVVRILRKEPERKAEVPAAPSTDEKKDAVALKVIPAGVTSKNAEKASTPAEEKKPEISPEQLRINRIQARRTRFRDLWDNCYAELHDFYHNILAGKIEAPEQPDEILSICWNFFLDEEVYLDRESILVAILDCDGYRASEEEYQKASALLSDMPIYLQMLSILYVDAEELELMDHSAEYVPEDGDKLKELLDCFRLFGFSFSNEEYDALANGTHEVYTQNEDEESAKTEDDAADKDVHSESEDPEDTADKIDVNDDEDEYVSDIEENDAPKTDSLEDFTDISNDADFPDMDALAA